MHDLNESQHMSKTAEGSSGWASFFHAWTLDRKGRLEEALDAYTRALKTFVQAGHDEGTIKATNGLAAVQSRLGRAAQARVLLTRALPTARKLQKRVLLAELLRTLGVACRAAADHEQARVHFQEALGFFEELLHLQGQADTHQSLGTLFHHNGGLKQAKRHFNQAKDLHEPLGDLANLAHDLNGLGEVARASGELLEAEAHYKRALEIFTPFNSDEDLAIVRANLGLVFYQRSDYQSAYPHLKRASTQFHLLGLLPHAAVMHAVLAHISALASGSGGVRTQLKALKALGLEHPPADPDYNSALRATLACVSDDPELTLELECLLPVTAPTHAPE